ncbi:hypothetical protein [Vibrio sp. DNB22_19_1]
MSNIFGVYDEVEELQGVISVDDDGNIQEMASIDEAGEVDVVATFDASGDAEAVFTNNIFGGTNEYTPDGELVSYSVPDQNIEGVEHVFDATDEFSNLAIEDEGMMEGDDFADDNLGNENVFSSFSLDDLG